MTDHAGELKVQVAARHSHRLGHLRNAQRFAAIFSDELHSQVNLAIGMFDGVHLMSLMGAAGVLELAGGILLLVGLFTRPAAFILSGEMAVANFMVHAPGGFLPILNQGELAVVYCFLFLYFSVAGAGAFSIDAARKKA